MAYDGSGDYSPFAEAFADEITKTSESIGDMMIDVRVRVKEATEGLGPEPQITWANSSLMGKFWFNPGAAAVQDAGTAQPVPPPQQLDVVSQRQPLEGAQDRYWATVKDSKDPAEYAAYLRKFPAGEFADIARARRDRYTPDPTTDADPVKAESVAFDKSRQAYSPLEIAGTYQAGWGPIKCTPAGAGLECCYGSNSNWSLRLALANGGRMLEGIWDHNDGRTGPVQFNLNERCELTSGMYGSVPGKLTTGWSVYSKIDDGRYTVTAEKFRGIVSSATGVFEGPDQLSRRQRRLRVGDVVYVTGRVENRLRYQIELDGGQKGYASMSAIERF